MPTELMFRRKPIMPVEQKVISWMAVEWTNEMSQEELLVARIR